MSVFMLKDTSVKVTLPHDLGEKEFLECPALQLWVTRLFKNLALQEKDSEHKYHKSPYEVNSIIVQAWDSWKGRVGFMKLWVEIRNKDNESLSSSVFLRGPSVAMLVILQPDDVPEDSEKDKFVILTVQPRIAAGTLGLVELPAGMVDDGTFSGAAAREIEEELGLKIPESKLTNLSRLVMPEEEGGENLPQGVFPSPGGCEEFIEYFLYQERVKRETLNDWKGKHTGLKKEENEDITLILCALDQLYKVGGRDGKALAAWAMYEGCRREGTLKIGGQS